MRLLAIDAATTIGCCLIEDGVPIKVETFKDVRPNRVIDVYFDERFVFLLGKEPPIVYIEIPNCWTRKGMNVQALMNVSAIAHSLGNLIMTDFWMDVHFVLVSDWKGRKPKKLTTAEAILILKAECGDGHMIAGNEHERDALAFGLWAWRNHNRMIGGESGQ